MRKTKPIRILLSYVLTISMLLGLLPSTVLAEEQQQIFECGQELHSHSEECYDESQTLICDKQEHTHTEQCLVQYEQQNEQNTDNTKQNTNDIFDDNQTDSDDVSSDWNNELNI